MRLRRLQLFGFKSFADRTELTFDHPLVGIVGPNGCGKSNVVDAIRWVLGEQRPTSMRGGEMVDVIFKGSVSRAAMNLAEVTLVLDNCSGALPGRGAEVAITRRVHKSGEGEYSIDGEHVRLKDVRDMLFDTGLGSRGYSVLEQGKIDAVLSVNPLDRRGIFEEAAGISRYRQRRKETEARLKRVQDDLTRLDDVLRELSSRVRSLKTQASRAERYLEARAAWQAARAHFARHRLWLDEKILAQVQARRAEQEARVQAGRSQREQSESLAGEAEARQAQLALDIERAVADVARLEGDARAAQERHGNLLARAVSMRGSAAGEDERAGQIERTLGTRVEELELAKSELQQRKQHQDAARQTGQNSTQSVRELRAKLRDLREREERQNEVVLGALHARTEAQNNARHLQGSKAPAAERGERLRARLDSEAVLLAELVARLAEFEHGENAARQAQAKASEHVASAAEELRRTDEDLAKVLHERTALALEQAKKTSRIDALRELELEREGLQSGTRALLEGHRGHQDTSATKLLGLLADHLRASTRDARALDAALGERALALCTQDMASARAWAAALSDKNGSQAILCWPNANAAGRQDREPLPRAVESGSKALCECLDIAPGFEPLARLFLGDVRLVETLDQALEFVALDPRWRYATRKGELIDAGSLIAGERELTQGAAGRRASAREIEQELAADAQRLELLDQEWRALIDAKQAGEQRLRSAQAELERCALALSEARASLGLTRGRSETLRQSLGLMEREHTGARSEYERIQADLAACESRLGQTQDEFTRENQTLADLHQARTVCEREFEQAVREDSEAQRILAQVDAQLTALDQRCVDLARATSEMQAEAQRARRIAHEHESGSVSLDEQARELLETIELALGERAQKTQVLDELRAQDRAGRERASLQRVNAERWTRDLERMQEDLARLSLDQQRVEMTSLELRQRLPDDLGQSALELLQGFEPAPEWSVLDNREELEAHLATFDLAAQECKLKLDQIGPVSLDAVSELEATAGRFEFLEGQRSDLEESRRALAETLAAIGVESTRLFLETFEQVRSHFQVLFRQLFGGGRADLELEAGVDPLEAGIEISARPPGREMLPIGLLSGGQRTMTALALLFAVFRSRPSPFCVLDEVDAALDDENVGRFLSMVDTFTAGTQFLVVTHNKGTMAACQALYGITMEVKGVSNHVSVEFSQVDRFVPQAVGDAAKSAQFRSDGGTGDRGDPAGQDPVAERIVELLPHKAGEENAPPALVAPKTALLPKLPRSRRTRSYAAAAPDAGQGQEILPADSALSSPAGPQTSLESN